MPKNTSKSGSSKKRRTSQPNVFVQAQAPEESIEDDDDEQISESTASTTSAPRVKARVERTTRRASVRSEIYTRSLSAELKKMGALAGAVVIALAVLTFAL